MKIRDGNQCELHDRSFVNLKLHFIVDEKVCVLSKCSFSIGELVTFTPFHHLTIYVLD